MKLIPYAGKEPDIRRHRSIPVDLVLQLRKQGLSWNKIADELCVRFGRNYRVDSIIYAVKRKDKPNRRRKNDETQGSNSD